MFYLDRHLFGTLGVKSILHHRLTTSHGRWSIVVSASRFEHVKTEFRKHLSKWCENIVSTNNLQSDASFAPRLAFKNDNTDEAESDGGYDSYISACSSIYSARTDDGYSGYDDPPTSSRPVPQAWKVNIPSVIATASSITTSEPNNDSTDRLKTENTQLRQQVHTLTEQVSRLTTRLDDVLSAISALTAAKESIQPGQPTATNVNMSVDASIESGLDDPDI
jgi:hypothetical protein